MKGVQHHYFVYGYSTPFVDNTFLSPTEFLGSLVEDQLTVNIRIYFRTLNSVSLIYMPILMIVTYIFLFFFLLLGLNSQYMEVPRLGVSLELQLLDYATATATCDPSCVCNLHHSS